jgi:hypothetical protein
MINNQVITALTGCRREDIREEILTGGSLPGKIITRKGNEYLCVEDQSYHDGTQPTTVPQDYVLVTVAQ